MPTVRELAAESIGRITRRGLEQQIAQIEAALDPGEQAIAMAPGREGTSGVVLVLTGDRLLASTGAPFAKPALVAHARAVITAAAAAPGDDGWTLAVEHGGDAAEFHGLFDRDAQRFAVALRPEPAAS